MTIAKQRRRAYTSRRIAQGAPPKQHDYPQLLATFVGFPCPINGPAWLETWQLWLRASRSYSDGWWGLKLCAAPTPGRIAGMACLKANYWLGWHVRDERWAGRNVEQAKLLQQRPMLHEAVELALKGQIKGQFPTSFEMVNGLAPQGQFDPYLPFSIAPATKGQGQSPEAPATFNSLGDPDEDLL